MALIAGLAWAAYCGATGLTPAAAELAPDSAVALVNQQPLHAAEVRLATAALLSETAPTSREDIRDAEHRARQKLAQDLALAQDAIAQGIEQDPEVQGRLAYYRVEILAQAFRQQQKRLHPIGDDELRAEYAGGAAVGIMEYHIQHILLPQERQARDLLTRLGKAEDFGGLAKLYSADSSSAANNGDLGWVRLDNFEDYKFADLVRSLKAGKYAVEPIKSSQGWHVLRLLEPPRAAADAVPFDKLSETLRAKLKKRAEQRMIDLAEAAVLRKASIKLLEPAVTGRAGS